jgi:hypothetical protein
MNYSGIVYVFDFDDTLMWNAEWHDEVPALDNGNITGPGDSGSLKAALSLIERASGMDIPDNLKDMRLRVDKTPQLNGRDTYFALLDSNDVPVSKEDLLPYFSDLDLKAASLEGPTIYSNYMAVTRDDPFYQTSDTLGGLGPNPEIMDLYKKNRENSVILTARQNIPGMNETIIDTLVRYGGGPPLAVYTRPPMGSSLVHKGSVIVDIAKQKDVTTVHFWDDNLEYIKGVQDALDEYDKTNGTNLSVKVMIHHVGKSNKPTSALMSIYDMIKLANQYDSVGMFNKADQIDNLAKDLLNVKSKT